MHKWFPGVKKEDLPAWTCGIDPGEVYYNWVHSLHHYAKNPTSFSGISMHPVESSGYYTAMFVPHQVLFLLQWLGVAAAKGVSIHPIVMLYTKLDLTMAALVGHDAIGYPGGGSQCHWLHHHLFDCNYGENYAPFDYWFGSYASDEADFEKLMGRRRSARAKKNDDAVPSQ